jgi:phosphatidylglycerol:prolipoprotein diacylglycerol transferase
MIHNIDPVLISIGPLEIRYYGLIYMLGFLAGYYFLNYAIKKQNIRELDKRDIDDFIFYTVISVVIGARLFEVLFYEPGYYFSNPLKIFAVWEGGLSFHGGLFGVFISTLIFSRKKKISLKIWGDFLSIPGAFALFLGRIANFINGELYGVPVDNQVNPPWYAVKFMKTDPQQLWRIPTQILESFKNLLILAVLLFLWKRYQSLKKGVLMWTLVFGYGLLRFIIEFWKDVYRDQLFGLSTGQLLSIPMMIIGIWGYYLSFRQKNI